MKEDVKSGLYYSGQVIGILKELRTAKWFEAVMGDVLENYKDDMLPGSLENAASYDFPVQFKGVDIDEFPEGPRTPNPSPELCNLMVKKAKEFVNEGVKLITTDCGFYSYIQDEMAEAVDIPVCTSALLQVPLISKLIGKNKRIGIITWDSSALSEKHLRGAGIDESIKIAIIGYEKMKEMDGRGCPILDTSLPREKRLEILEEIIVAAAEELLSKHSDIGAFLLECTAFPPAAKAVNMATGLPVFDVVLLLNFIGHATSRNMSRMIL